MFKHTISEIVDHYTRLVSLHGDSPGAGQWDETSQAFRFAQLIRIMDLSGKSVLDFGCGIGDLFGYLNQQRISCSYTGIDIVPAAIELAAHKYRNTGATFLCQNIFDHNLAQKYDVVLMSGVFNNMTANGQYMREILKKVFPLARLGVAFNFISDRVNFRDTDMMYHDPVAVVQFCIDELSRKTALFHHYERCDVSVYMYPVH